MRLLEGVASGRRRSAQSHGTARISLPQRVEFVLRADGASAHPLEVELMVVAHTLRGGPFTVEVPAGVNPAEALGVIGALQEALAAAAANRDTTGEPSRLARMVETRNAILSYGGDPPLRWEEVSRLLRLTRGGVWDRKASGLLLALRDGPRRLLYPAWQFDTSSEDGIVSGLRGLIAAMPVEDSWALAGMLTRPQPSLGGQVPIEELRAGGERRDRAVRKLLAMIRDSYDGATRPARGERVASTQTSG